MNSRKITLTDCNFSTTEIKELTSRAAFFGKKNKNGMNQVFSIRSKIFRDRPTTGVGVIAKKY